MTVPNMIGRPTQLAITTPNVTITSLQGATVQLDKEILAFLPGNKQQDLHLEGKKSATLSITTADVKTVLNSLSQGVRCTTVVLTAAAPKLSDGTGQNAEVMTVTLSHAVVETVGAVTLGNDGNPATVDVTFRLTLNNANGSEGTMTVGFA